VSTAKEAAGDPEILSQIAHWIARGIEAVGIFVIVAGALVATAVFLRQLNRQSGLSGAYHRYRSNLGRSILLGLEFLVAADIIGTVAVDPTFRSLGVLALIVVIRTFLSFSLEVEINGHWPWQDSKYVDKEGAESL
jgi:uncharacterized membrane protein